MWDDIKKYQSEILWGLSLLAVGVGMTDLFRIPILLLIGGLGMVYLAGLQFVKYLVHNPTNHSDDDVDKLTEEYNQILEKNENLLLEQEQVIKEYENIFDSLLVQIPCNCGNNSFEGLFSPSTNNEMVCEKCKSKYRIDITYDAVLLTDPLDVNQSMEDIVGGEFQ